MESANQTQMLNVHCGLSDPATNQGADLDRKLVGGDYEYWHYGCDGFDDRGWGCGYRTLQTLCSWIRHQREESSPLVPSLPKIQDILVEIEDKPSEFKGSRDWIGSVEVCMVIDHLYNIPSKIVHVQKGVDLDQHFPTLRNHFQTLGSPVMMGGDQDASSKGIFGTLDDGQSKYLLIVDPHYWGKAALPSDLYSNNWIHWRKLEDFHDSSFYNLCLPQIKSHVLV